MRFKVYTKPPFSLVDEIVIATAKQVNLPIPVVRDVMHYCFTTIKEFLSNPIRPRLGIPYFGVFEYKYKYYTREYRRLNKRRKEAKHQAAVEYNARALRKLALHRSEVSRSAHSRKFKIRFPHLVWKTLNIIQREI